MTRARMIRLAPWPWTSFVSVDLCDVSFARNDARDVMVEATPTADQTAIITTQWNAWPSVPSVRAVVRNVGLGQSQQAGISTVPLRACTTPRYAL